MNDRELKWRSPEWGRQMLDLDSRGISEVGDGGWVCVTGSGWCGNLTRGTETGISGRRAAESALVSAGVLSQEEADGLVLVEYRWWLVTEATKDAEVSLGISYDAYELWWFRFGREASQSRYLEVSSDCGQPVENLPQEKTPPYRMIGATERTQRLLRVIEDLTVGGVGPRLETLSANTLDWLATRTLRRALRDMVVFDQILVKPADQWGQETYLVREENG